MDINFHYYAVKTLAVEAGFSEQEAQRIAQYSEFIDDFNWKTYLDCRNIPDYIKNDADCDLHIKILNMNFNPAMTGFYTWHDYGFLALERTQKFTVSPFHFLPRNLNDLSKSARTTPATIGDGSIISNMLAEARDALNERVERRNLSLMRIGMYLHTFADTYAHQLFSGYQSWVNEVRVAEVFDNSTNDRMEVSDVVGPDAEQEANDIIPAIGHAIAGHTPDLTYISFIMSYKRDERDSAYSLTHSRSNTTEFLHASRAILNYLRSCNGLSPIEEDPWSDLAAKLAEVFLIHYTGNTQKAEFERNWHSNFPAYTYDFDAARIEASFLQANAAADEVNSHLGKNYTDEFYDFNYIADKVLNRLYGRRPRDAWLN